MTISHRVCCGSALLAATVWAALLFVDSSPVRADESAVATSPVRAAEAAYEAITASASSENDLRTEELARQFLVRWPRDPLSARVELELGRLFVLRSSTGHDGAAGATIDAANLAAADSWLARALTHADPPTRQRAMLYQGVVMQVRGDHRAAADALLPLRGALIDPEDRRLHQSALEAACEGAGNIGCALEALDALRVDCADEADCTRLDESIVRLAETSFTDASAHAWVLETPPSRFAWRALASRVIRDAARAGEWEVVQALALRARDAGIVLDAEGRTIARQLDRGLEPDPRVVGIIVGLTGGDSAVGLSCASALATAAGAPTSDTFNPDAFRIIVRDHRGDPAEAARAVNDLFWTHRAIAIIGPTNAEANASAAARAVALGMPYVALAATAPSRFVVNAPNAQAASWLLAAAAARFGSELGIVTTRSAARSERDDSVFGHTAGRIDSETRARLGVTPRRFLLVEARTAELPRVISSLRLALRRNPSHPKVVISEDAFRSIRSRETRQALEGAYVLAPVRDASDATIDFSAANAVRTSFNQIVAAHATTRPALADELALAIPPDGLVADVVFRVADGALVPRGAP